MFPILRKKSKVTVAILQVERAELNRQRREILMSLNPTCEKTEEKPAKKNGAIEGQPMFAGK